MNVENEKYARGPCACEDNRSLRTTENQLAAVTLLYNRCSCNGQYVYIQIYTRTHATHSQREASGVFLSFRVDRHFFLFLLLLFVVVRSYLFDSRRPQNDRGVDRLSRCFINAKRDVILPGVLRSGRHASKSERVGIHTRYEADASSTSLFKMEPFGRWENGWWWRLWW